MPTGLLCACSLGLIDVPPLEPSPAFLTVSIQLHPDPIRDGGVELQIEADLDPGVSDRGEARAVIDDRLRVAGSRHTPTARQRAAHHVSWDVRQRHPRPGPRSLRIGWPEVEGVPTPADAEVQIGVSLTPADSVSLADGEDLVLTVAAPEAGIPSGSPFSGDRQRWRLRLRGVDGFDLTLAASRWLREVRVDSERLPRSAFPLTAILQIQLLDTEAAVEGAGASAYRVTVATSIVTRFVVTRRVVAPARSALIRPSRAAPRHDG